MLGSWFHRNINGIQAERLLKETGQDGSFLIRPSNTTSDSYTLSVRQNDKVKHIKIQNNSDEGGYEIGEGGDQFATVAELVEYFVQKEVLRDKSDGSMLVLKYPLNCNDPTNERYFHGAISGSEAENLLKSKGKVGSYLVRESRSNPNNYVLCVRCENLNVVHLIINYTPSGYTMQNLNKHFKTLDELVQECIKMSPLVDIKDNVVYLKHPLNCSRVTAQNFVTRFQELDQQNKHKTGSGFSEEFEQLQQVDGKYLYERKVGCSKENITKNRFKTILPFDYNRIILRDRKNTPNEPNDSDYINANRIIGEGGVSKCYLATQGPLPNTIADFWLMVWQEESQIILMITNEEEKGKSKCSKYWPDESSSPVQYDKLTVKFVRLVKRTDDYVVKELLLSNKSSTTPSERVIYHYQFITWSDHSVPEDVKSSLDFIKDFNDVYDRLNNAKPVTIHCSAGIGRTGAIIVIDMVLDRIKKYGQQCEIDIFKTVCKLRSQRSGMIQTEKQYQFVYCAIRHFIQNVRSSSSS